MQDYQVSFGNRFHRPEVQLASLLRALEDPTNNLCRTVVPGERERRMRLCENLKSNLKKASEEFYRGGSFRGPFTKVADLGTVNWGDEESESTKGLTNEELRSQQREVVQAQDAVLESLSAVVGSQRHIAQSIQSEVEDQDDLLIDIQDRTTVTQASLEQQTSNITEATRKASTWGYWIVVVLLLIAIIIVAVW
ncbi:hypothetical protein Avbf_14414 [Armadillidium vulgare]|nr:hypothetical protein Avbf_14414 [Armadillidium vulgare]